MLSACVQSDQVQCGKCSGLYSPDRGEQRYCGGCKEWYHVECLNKANSPAALQALRRDLSELVEFEKQDIEFLAFLLCPAARGMSWGVVGTRRPKARALKWAKNLSNLGQKLPLDWSAQLGEHFLDSFICWGGFYFCCPRCPGRFV